jgi:DNA-binding PadR family transcriptional regulator
LNRRIDSTSFARTNGFEVALSAPFTIRTIQLAPLNYFYIVYIMSRDHLGGFEHVVILALMRLREDAYGVTIRQEIEARTRRGVSIGAVYATLDRLERKGYVKSNFGEPTAERGGRSKRFFRVTSKGVTAVNRTHTALSRLIDGLDIIRGVS